MVKQPPLQVCDLLLVKPAGAVVDRTFWLFQLYFQGGLRVHMQNKHSRCAGLLIKKLSTSQGVPPKVLPGCGCCTCTGDPGSDH